MAVSNWHLQEEQDVQNTTYYLITLDNSSIYITQDNTEIQKQPPEK